MTQRPCADFLRVDNVNGSADRGVRGDVVVAERVLDHLNWLRRVSVPSQDVARLAVQYVADCIERREPDGSSSPVLEYGDVRWREADCLRELSDAEPTVTQQLVESDPYRH